MINYNFLKTLNILYVENDESIKKDFLNIIHGLFKNIISVCSSDEAIEEFIQNQKNSYLIDVVISDIYMPNINGIELLKKIREIDLKIPVVFISNNQDASKLLEAIKYSATDYLAKPVTKKSLIDSIQKVCTTRHHDKFVKDMEENLEELISTVNDVAMVSKTNLKGDITFVNKFFCDTSGYRKKEIIGQSYKFVRAEQSNTLQSKKLWDTIKEGKVWEEKVKYISKTKEIFFAYLTIIPMYKALDNSIKEYMWIRFLSTEEEIEQSEFKKKVAMNIHSSRRINLEARAEIDRLFKELDDCKRIDSIKYSLMEEKKRTSKFINQIAFYKKEINTKARIIDELNKSAKIKTVAEFDFKNKDINALNEELDNQIDLLEALKASI